MKHYFLFLISLLTLAACSKSDPEPKPSLVGTIKLADEFGASQSDRGGILVTVTDVSPQITTRTAADGTFALRGVPDGFHKVYYSKPGYGTYKWDYVPTDIQGNSKLPDVTLGQVSSTLVTVQVAQPNDIYIFSGTVTPTPTATQPRLVRIYLMRDRLGNLPPIEGNYDYTFVALAQPDGTFSENLTRLQLSQAGLTSASGTTVRVRAAGDNPAATLYQEGGSLSLIHPAANLAANPRTITFFSN